MYIQSSNLTKSSPEKADRTHNNPKAERNPLGTENDPVIISRGNLSSITKTLHIAVEYKLVALPVLQRTGRWGAKHSFLSVGSESRPAALQRLAMFNGYLRAVTRRRIWSRRSTGWKSLEATSHCEIKHIWMAAKNSVLEIFRQPHQETSIANVGVAMLWRNTATMCKKHCIGA